MRGQPDMYVRIDALGQVGLPGDVALRAVVLALTELGAAQALALIHGPERGFARYVEAGGVVRFTSYGEPFIPVFTRQPKPAGRKNWHILENVVSAQMRTDLGRRLGPDTGRRARWWDLALECGHAVQRAVTYRAQAKGSNPDRATRPVEDANPAPKRIRCDECTAVVVRSAAQRRREAEREFLS